MMEEVFSLKRAKVAMMIKKTMGVKKTKLKMDFLKYSQTKLKGRSKIVKVILHRKSKARDSEKSSSLHRYNSQV